MTSLCGLFSTASVEARSQHRARYESFARLHTSHRSTRSSELRPAQSSGWSGPTGNWLITVNPGLVLYPEPLATSTHDTVLVLLDSLPKDTEADAGLVAELLAVPEADPAPLVAELEDAGCHASATGPVQ